MRRDIRGLWLVLLLVAEACDRRPLAVEDQPPGVREVLFSHADGGALFGVLTDGTGARPVGPETSDSLTPLAYAPAGRLFALLVTNAGRTIALAHREALGERTTILTLFPSTLIGPAAFSPDERYLVLPAYFPLGPALLIYDRAERHWDTVMTGEPGPALAPVFSPDGSEIAVLAVTQLSLWVIRVGMQDRQVRSERVATSRFVNQPIFGWPQWSPEAGMLLLVRRGTTTIGPDTLAVVALDPDHPDRGLRDLFSLLAAPARDAADLAFGPRSSYSVSRDGQVVIMAAHPDLDPDRHALFVANRLAPRVELVRDDPTRFEVYPLLLN